METDADAPAVAGIEIESTHTHSHKSARPPPIEVITRGERRRRWTAEEKQAIAAQSLAPGASASEIARRHGISTGLLYTWRRALLAAQPARLASGVGPFARVEVVPTRTAGRTGLAAASRMSAQPAGMIEIVLGDGMMVRVDGQVDAAALCRVLAVLRG